MNMKEKTQRMFRKVQLRFVAITMSIILAIFIAVLGSINLIMQNMMQRQSQAVLNKIASNINYDEKTSVFSFIPEGEPAPDMTGEKWELFPEHTTAPPTSQTTQTSHTQTVTSVQTTAPPDTTEEESQIQETEAEESSENLPETQPEPQTENTEPENSFPPETEYPSDNVTEPQPEPVPEIPTEPLFPDYPQKPDSPPWDYEHDDFPPDYYPPDYRPDDRPDYPERDDDYEDYEDDEDNYDSFIPQRPERYDWYSPENYHDDIENLSFSGADILSDYYVLNAVAPVQKKHINDIPPKKIDSIDYFVLMADASGKLLDIFNNDDIDNSLAQRYIDSILDDGASSGMLESLQFCISEKPNGTVLVFTDKSAEIEILNNLMKTTVMIGSISFVLLSILVVFLSHKSIEPVQQAFEKQKQFISDASHELKTPLTIISANADVLSGEIGNNKWLNYIQSQAYRMSLLVNDLLNLTRLENNSANMTFSEFNLSQAVMNTALPFECQAFEAHKKFDVDVEENIMLTASERHCKQLFAIFIDNAIKHSEENGTVKVSLTKSGDKKIFSVYNTGSGIRDDEKDKIFERFYRSDDSRSRNTGGYGLGLAIARSIIDYHKFKLNIENSQGKYIKFIITMQ